MKQVLRTTAGGVAVAGLTAGLLAVGVASATAAEPVDSATLVEVDKPGTTMISAAPFDVGAYGYTEREFFASGEAHRFQNADGSVFGWSPQNSMSTAVRGDIAGDYKTRVIIRQPSAEKFNGTLVVELTNVTTGNDGEFTFAESHDTLLTEGYAVAVVSAKKVGVDNVVATRPERYGDLDVEPEDCAPGVCPEDIMSIDIFTQVSKALKDSPSSPFAEIGDVEKVIAVGQSGSASNLSIYYNKIQPIYDFFDGFVFWDGAGALRTDVSTPGLDLSSWTWNTGGAVPVTGQYTRAWEVNGAAHGSAYAHEYFDEVFVRDGTQPDGGSFTDWHLGIGNCSSRQVGTKVHVGQVIGAAIDNVDTWVRGGEPAAPDATFQRNPDGTLAFDENGRVIGGVQIADAAAPSWRYEHNTGGWTCPAAGAWAAYAPEELNEMYGSHAGYVTAVTDVTEAALEARHILSSDAAKTIAEAKASTIGAAVSDDSQEIEVSVPEAAAGEFMWSIDGSNGLVNLGDAVENGDHYAAAGEINPVRVTDTRSGAPEWSVSASVSEFAAGDATFSGKYLGWTPKAVESGTRVQSGAVVGSGFDGGKGLSVSSTLGFGQTGHDRASALLGADLDLKIPLEVGQGIYAATLTLTALS